jgi:hypothetical protein
VRVEAEYRAEWDKPRSRRVAHYGGLDVVSLRVVRKGGPLNGVSLWISDICALALVVWKACAITEEADLI